MNSERTAFVLVGVIEAAMVAHIDSGRRVFASVEVMWLVEGDHIDFARIASASAAQTMVGNYLAVSMNWGCNHSGVGLS
jgi:hypothetical protein